MAELILVDELIKAGITLVAAGAGTLLSVRVWPLKAKHDAWFLEKQIQCETEILESLSKIRFLVEHNNRMEYGHQYSWLESSETPVSKQVIGLIQVMIIKSSEYQAYLAPKQWEQVKGFIDKSQGCLDNAMISHGEWHAEDYDAEQAHEQTYLFELSQLANETLNQIRFKYLKNYK